MCNANTQLPCNPGWRGAKGATRAKGGKTHKPRKSVRPDSKVHTRTDFGAEMDSSAGAEPERCAYKRASCSGRK